MADEPNKHMEEILRAYTEARGKGANLPLHSATRKMLHEEVARRFKAATVRRPFWSRVRGIWPQLAFGSGLCAILLVAVLSLRQRPTEQDREGALGVSIQPKKSFQSAQPAAEQSKSAQAPSTTAADSLLKRDQLEQRAVPAENLNAPVKAAPKLQIAQKEEEQLARGDEATPIRRELRTQLQVSGGAAVALSAASKEKALDSSSTSFQNASKRTASVAAKAPQVNDLTNLGDALRLHFVELPGGRQSATPQVLTSFQLEQQGDDLRFMDQDGSVYLGQVVTTPPAQLTQPVQAVDARSFGLVNRGVQLNEVTQNTTAYFFRAAGTNVTLAKPVLIEGRYFERTNTASTYDLSKDAAKPAGSAQMLGRARHAIIGKATVARTNEISVNAVSVEPGN